MSSRTPLMGAKGARDWQNNSYRTTASAVAELVDNSIQAKATNVDIIIISQKAETGHDHTTDLYVVDNGEGMNENLFQQALQFSGGNRFGATQGLGRYGMGLPNSSVSQTKRFEVYTWQTHKNEKKLLFNYVDLEEIHETQDPFLNEVQHKEDVDERVREFSNFKEEDSGTIVKWVNVNRVRPKTPPYLQKHLNDLLGKKFRYYIKGDGVPQVDISIKVYDYNGESYEEDKQLRLDPIKPYDPLFLMRNTQLEDILGEEYSEPTSIEFESATIKRVEELDNGETRNHEVLVRFSYVNPKVREQHGRNAGTTDFGQEYLYKKGSAYDNISIVRAKREIASGRFGFITDVSDQTNRWWSVEVQIDPVSDEVFGIDNSKQNVNNFGKYDDDKISTEDEDFVESLMREVSEKISENIKSLKNKIDEGTSSNGRTPPGEETNEGEEDEGQKVPELIDVDGTNGKQESEGKEITDEDRKEAEKWILQRYPENNEHPKRLKETVDWFLHLPAKHYIVFSDLGDIELYSYKTFGDKTVIEINYRHSFFDKLIRDIEDSDDREAKYMLRFLFSSMVKAEKQFQGQGRIMKKFRAELSTQLEWLIDAHVKF